MDDTIRRKLDDLTKDLRPETYSQGNILLHATDNPSGVFYLVDGGIRQYDITDGGDEVVVNVFKPGAFFPMTWAVNQTPNQYFFEAVTDSSVKTIPVQTMIDFLSSNPDVTFDLLRRLLSGASGMQRRMAHLMGGESFRRLIYELLVESRRFGEQQPDGSTVISTGQAELARRAGLTRETVNREIKKLKQSEHIKISGKKIIIKDIANLESHLGSNL